MLGSELGLSKDRVYQLRAGRVPTIGTGQARVIAELFDRLPDLGDNAPDPRVRRKALAAGWAPPFAWDEDTIDDPAARPAHRAAAEGPYLRYDPGGVELEMAINGYLPLSRTEHHPKILKEAVRYLTEAVALPVAEIAERLHTTERTVLRIRSSLRSADRANAPEVLPASESPTPKVVAA